MTATRILEVKHKTTYTYDKMVKRSVHKLHAKPIEDSRQRLMQYSLRVTPETTLVEFEDVFGNPSVRFNMDKPYNQLEIDMHAVVELQLSDPFAFASIPIKRTFPLVWMPFQQIMLAPYLQHPELPDTQIEELFEYAMSFASSNNWDLMETLFAINLKLFKEYQYVPGTTKLTTTPYEVYCAKQGVCQDFTNLFITLARLLGVPARYVCGYLYTGNTGGSSRAMSDASHAWIELFIPNTGWKGFDPTNGILPNADHIRLSCGRNYKDVAPTSGTLYSVAQESILVDVEVNEINQANL